MQSYVKDNNGRRRSLRHANISNRFTCLLSDNDDDSSIPTDHDKSTISHANAATNDYQVYRDLEEMK